MTPSLQTIAQQIPSSSSSSTSMSSTAVPASGGPALTTHSEGPLMVVPSGFLAELVHGLQGTIEDITGGFFGQPHPGTSVASGGSPGSAGGLLPFQLVAPALTPQSAGPANGQSTPAPQRQEPLVVVPAAFLGGLLGGIGGNLLGSTVGDWLGNKQAGASVGSTIGGIVGGLLPFQVLPATVAPQSTGSGSGSDPMVVVPAGFFGNLLAGVAQTVSHVSGDSTVQEIAGAAGSLAGLLPFSEVPPTLLPASTAPGVPAAPDRMILVPAGFFGSLLSGLAGTVGSAVGGLLGDSQTGGQVGSAIAPVLDMLPFHAVPPQLVPQSAGPGQLSTSEPLMFVPAGLFAGLLSGLAGTVGGVVGGLLGNSSAGTAIGSTIAPILNLLPFHTVAPASLAASN